MGNGNTLQFSLGLATGGFLSGIGGAANALKGFTGTALSLPGLGTAIGGVLASVGSLGAVVSNIFAQFSKGAELQSLSNRMRESVGDVYRLQKGFAAVGSDAGVAEPAIRAMQRALGGFNEMGEPTRNIFEGLGLSVEALKEMNAPAQLDTIFQKLALLNREEGAFAAGRIFGRYAGPEMLNAARRRPEFAAGMETAGPTADLYQRNAAAWAKIEVSMGRVKNLANGLFANIAEGAAPAVKGVLDTLTRIDLSGIGRQIGSVLSIATEAFREGKFGELLYLGLAAGTEKAGNFILQQLGGIGFTLGEIFSNGQLWVGFLEAGLGAFAALGAGLLDTFKMPLIYVQASMEFVIQGMAEGLKKMLNSQSGFQVMKKLLSFDMVDFKAESFGTILKGAKETGLSLFGSSTEDIADAAGANLKSGIAKLKAEVPKLGEAFKIGADLSLNLLGTENQEKLKQLTDGLAARAPKGTAATTPPERDNIGLLGSGSKDALRKTEGNSLEKIGALFFGGRGQDYAAETARTSGRMLEELKRMHATIRGQQRQELINQ